MFSLLLFPRFLSSCTKYNGAAGDLCFSLTTLRGFCEDLTHFSASFMSRNDRTIKLHTNQKQSQALLLFTPQGKTNVRKCRYFLPEFGMTLKRGSKRAGRKNQKCLSSFDSHGNNQHSVAVGGSGVFPCLTHEWPV